MKDEPINIGDEKQTKKRKTKLDLIRERELEDMRFLLSIPQGRRTLWRLLAKYKLLKTISVYDAHRMAIASGYRDAGLWLLGEVETADKNGYLKLFKESQNV